VNDIAIFEQGFDTGSVTACDSLLQSFVFEKLDLFNCYRKAIAKLSLEVM